MTMVCIIVSFHCLRELRRIVPIGILLFFSQSEDQFLDARRSSEAASIAVINIRPPYQSLILLNNSRVVHVVKLNFCQIDL